MLVKEESYNWELIKYLTNWNNKVFIYSPNIIKQEFFNTKFKPKLTLNFLQSL